MVAQNGLEKTEAVPISAMTWKSKASKRTILSTFGAEASACRDALDLAEYTRAMLCEVVIGGRVLPEELMPIRAITDCKSLFDCSAKDASVPEDWRNRIDGSLSARQVFGRGGKRPETGPTTSTIGRGTDFWNRSESESLEEETNHKQFEKGSGRLWSQ